MAGDVASHHPQRLSQVLRNLRHNVPMTMTAGYSPEPREASSFTPRHQGITGSLTSLRICLTVAGINIHAKIRRF